MAPTNVHAARGIKGSVKGRAPVRQEDLPATALYRLYDVRSGRVAARSKQCVILIERAAGGRRAREAQAVRIGLEQLHHALGLLDGGIAGVRGDGECGGRVAVVCAVDAVDVLARGVVAREAQGEVVGLRAAVHEEACRQRVRHRRRQLLRQPHDVVMQVAAVGIELAELDARGCDDARVAMADVAHVVDEVQVLLARLVVQELTAAVLQLQRSSGRLGIVCLERGRQVALAQQKIVLHAQHWPLVRRELWCHSGPDSLRERREAGRHALCSPSHFCCYGAVLGTFGDLRRCALLYSLQRFFLATASGGVPGSVL